MMEQNTTNKPLRRVGTLTLGVCLIAAGTLFLLARFLPGLPWLVSGREKICKRTSESRLKTGRNFRSLLYPSVKDCWPLRIFPGAFLHS